MAQLSIFQRLALHKQRKAAMEFPCLAVCVDGARVPWRTGPALVGALPLSDFIHEAPQHWRELCHAQAQARQHWSALIESRTTQLLGVDFAWLEAKCQWLPIGQLWLPALILRANEASFERLMAPASRAWRAAPGEGADNFCGFAKAGLVAEAERAGKKIGLFEALASLGCAHQIASHSLPGQGSRAPSRL